MSYERHLVAIYDVRDSIPFSAIVAFRLVAGPTLEAIRDMDVLDNGEL